MRRTYWGYTATRTSAWITIRDLGYLADIDIGYWGREIFKKESHSQPTEGSWFSPEKPTLVALTKSKSKQNKKKHKQQYFVAQGDPETPRKENLVWPFGPAAIHGRASSFGAFPVWRLLHFRGSINKEPGENWLFSYCDRSCNERLRPPIPISQPHLQETWTRTLRQTHVLRCWLLRGYGTNLSRCK